MNEGGGGVEPPHQQNGENRGIEPPPDESARMREGEVLNLPLTKWQE